MKIFTYTLSETRVLNDLENCSLGFILTVIRDNCKDDHTVEYINKLLEKLMKEYSENKNK